MLCNLLSLLCAVSFGTYLRDHPTLTLQQRKSILARYGSLARARPQDVVLPVPGGYPLADPVQLLDASCCSADGCNAFTISMPKL
jgi:hypothetical protein